MQPRTCVLSAFALGAAMAFGAAAMAADLPPSGTIKMHTAQKAALQIVQVGEKHFMGSGNVWGVSYNDAGSGPLHMGTVLCTVTLENLNGSFTDGGNCAVGDPGGTDKIFMVWSGKGTDKEGERGAGTLTGGIGRFAGIKGKITYECKFVEASQGLLACSQQIDYQLE